MKHVKPKMGSKKHKKHHKSEKKEVKDEDRQEKSLKLVLKVGGSAGGLQTPVPSPSAIASPHSAPPAPPPPPPQEPAAVATPPAAFRVEGTNMVCHAHEGSSSKHKKSKKKKKKKSSSKEHREKRHRHHHHRHHRHHHHHHKDSEKKEKRKCEHECSLGSEEKVAVAASAVEPPPPAKRPRLELTPAPREPSPPPAERPVRDPRSCTLKKKSDKSPLQMLLYYLLNNLQKRDPQEFFAWPVNDIIAPGYSTIIHSPMDFSTMRKKIDDSDYACVNEFKEDLKLMCDNAMTYNRSDTVYFKSAKRMWYSGNKLMSKDQLLGLEGTLPFFVDLTSEELGFDVKGNATALSDVRSPQEVAEAPAPVEAAPLGSPEFAKKSKSGSSEEGASDDQSSNEILIQAQKAAQAAADRLTLKKANSKFGFLRQMEDGSTTLSILNPDCGETKGAKEIKVNLEMLVGKLAHGTGSLMDFKDDIKNIARPINYLNYGTYSTYAPHYDSTFANLSKEESDLVYSTYGDELGVQYAESLLSFAKDCDYVMDMVDNLLDVMTSGEHSKTVKVLEAHRNGVVPDETDLGSITNHADVEEMEVEQPELKRADTKPLDSAVYALSDLSADSTVGDSNHSIQPPVQPTFPEHQEAHEARDHHEHHDRRDHHEHHDRHDHIQNTVSESSSLDSADSDINAVLQQKLQESKEMIDTLSRLQQERLSATPPAHLSHIQGASELELELAEKIAKTLSELASHAKPGSIVSVEAIRKAMGINYPPAAPCHHHHSCPHVASPYSVSAHDLPDSSSSNDVSLRANDSPSSNT